MRVQVAPSEGLRAGYQIMTSTGTMAAGLAAASEIWQFRWTSSVNRCLVQQVLLSFRSLGTGFTAGVVDFTLTAARSFTAAGTGGGTATLTTNNGKLRTADGTTTLGEIRTATTAALGTGTKTLDAQPYIGLQGSVSNAANTQFIPVGGGALVPMHDATRWDGSQAIVLQANEGLIIRATVPATGTWEARIGVAWQEASNGA